MELPLPKELPSISALPSWSDLLEAAHIRSRPTSSVDVISGMSLFAAGILVGAGLGLLFAPSSGERLRHDLTAKIGELRERLETGFSEMSEENGGSTRAREGRVA
jgi:hypothetical protein